jgi:hypothetical protein
MVSTRNIVKTVALNTGALNMVAPGSFTAAAPAAR